MDGFFGLLVIGAIIWFFVARSSKNEHKDDGELEKRLSAAYSRSDLFQLNLDYQSENIKKSKSKKDVKNWAEAMQIRYQNAEKHLDDAKLVIDDKISNLNKTRENIKTIDLEQYKSFVGNSDKMIEEIASKADIQEVDVINSYQFPDHMQPRKISARIDQAGLASFHVAKGASNMGAGNPAAIGIGMLAGIALQGYQKRKAIKQAEELEKQIDEFCSETASALITLEGASSKINQLTELHKRAQDNLQKNVINCREIFGTSLSNGLIDAATSDQKRQIEQLAVSYRQLKRIMEIEVT